MRVLTIIPKIIATGIVAAGMLSAAPSIAQVYGPNQVPPYTTWQPGWDRGDFDRGHVMLGTVSDFSPYRLTVTRRDGLTQTIDLKRGTEILPTGATPHIGERAALVGYYSNGTFVADRVVLRPYHQNYDDQQ
jgi:hypothetical protein